MGKKVLTPNAIVVCEFCRKANPKKRRLRKRFAVYLPKTLTRQGLYYHRKCATPEAGQVDEMVKRAARSVVDEFLGPI